MNKQFLKIPQYFQLNNINSAALETALTEPDILSYLREVYERDSNMFYKVRDEMMLRGFEFSTAIRSNRFPALLFEPKSIIVVKGELDLYKKIPRGILGIESLMSFEPKNTAERIKHAATRIKVMKVPALSIKENSSASVKKERGPPAEYPPAWTI